MLLQAPPSPCLPHLGSPVAAAASLLCFVPLPGGGKKQLIFSNIILFFDPKKTSRVHGRLYNTRCSPRQGRARRNTAPLCLKTILRLQNHFSHQVNCILRAVGVDLPTSRIFPRHQRFLEPVRRGCLHWNMPAEVAKSRLKHQAPAECIK